MEGNSSIKTNKSYKKVSKVRYLLSSKVEGKKENKENKEVREVKEVKEEEDCLISLLIYRVKHIILSQIFCNMVRM